MNRIKCAAYIGTLACFCVLSLWGCGKNGKNTENKAPEHRAAEENADDTAVRTRKYYTDLLSQLAYERTLPDIEVDTTFLDQDYCEMSENLFAITDVDKDGSEELIISYSTTCCADKFEVVYAYDPDTDQLKQELITCPGLSVYHDNGMVQIWDQKGSGRTYFHPYALFQYQKDSDSYEMIGYVTAWEKACYAETFPDELDIDGDGLLYNIQSGSDLSYAELNYDDNEYKYDQADYDEWFKVHMGDAHEIQIDYRPLVYEEFIDPILDD